MAYQVFIAITLCCAIAINKKLMLWTATIMLNLTAVAAGVKYNQYFFDELP
jgi:hypothetical protein